MHEIVPYLSWSPDRNVLSFKPSTPEAVARVFRQIEACVSGRQTLVIGGHNGALIIALYLVCHLSPTIPPSEVLDLLDTKLPSTRPTHFRREVQAMHMALEPTLYG